MILLYPRPTEWLGIIKRTCQGLDELTMLRTLYCSLVRSNLEYSVRWCGPRIQKEILIRVQRRATKFILKSDDPYDICLKRLNLMSLQKGRLLTDVTFLYKVFLIMATLILMSANYRFPLRS